MEQHEEKISKARKLKRNEKGITLIALVITIIVLLILVGVSISMLSGKNSILTRASEANVETRGATVEEQVELWKVEKTQYEYRTRVGKTATAPETLEELVERLNGEGLLKDEEVDQIIGNETENIEATKQITIGKRTIVFEETSTGLTIGEAYGNEIKQGDSFAYTSNGQTNWVVLGKDTNNNVLLTTAEPIMPNPTLSIGSDDASEAAQAWLNYEDTINGLCDDYGTTIQGKTVTSRSIKIEDINSALGFTEPTNLGEYTFGDTFGFGEGNVNYWYPDADSATGTTYSYWKKGGNKKFADEMYRCYSYGKDGDKFMLYKNAHGSDTEIATNDLTNLGENEKNWKMIVGDNNDYQYFVASRCVDVNSYYAEFGVSNVYEGYVDRDGWDVCYGYSGGVGVDDLVSGLGLRPVVSLASDILVEDSGNGTYQAVSN